MVKNNSKCFKHNPNVARQINAMRTLYPGFQAVQTDAELSFVGTLRVRDGLPEYKIKIKYRGHLSPYVTVLSPKLVENPPMFIRRANIFAYIILIIIGGRKTN